MGYSIAVICKSAVSQQKMLRFLGKHFKHFSDDPVRYISEPRSELSYSDSKVQVGFDYKSGWGAFSYERAYYFSILHWIALKVGARKTKIGKYKVAKSSPYVRYDGYENWPVLVDKPKSKTLQQFWVDELGMLRENLFYLWVTELFFSHVLYFKDNLHPDAEKILGRKISRGGEPFTVDEQFTIDERNLLVTTICKPQIDAAKKHIHDELQRLNDEWERFET